jgi:hypothetical protein
MSITTYPHFDSGLGRVSDFTRPSYFPDTKSSEGQRSRLTGKSAVCYPVHSSSARLFRAYFPAASLEVALLLNSPECLAGNRRPKGFHKLSGRML